MEATGQVRVIYAASEATPYAKIGGLADVAGALPKALRRLGIDVSVVVPRYGGQQAGSSGRSILSGLNVPFASGYVEAGVYADDANGLPVYLIDAPQYFKLHRALPTHMWRCWQCWRKKWQRTSLK